MFHKLNIALPFSQSLRIGNFYDFPTSGILTTSVNTAYQTAGNVYDVIGRIGSISTLKVHPRRSPTVGDFYDDCEHEIFLSGTSGMLDFVFTCYLSLIFTELSSIRPRSNVLNILTEQHWTFVQQSWVLFSDVQLLGGQTCWTFCWTRLNFVLTITHCARANWTNVQWLVKRTEQHSTSRKTKEMLSRSTFVQWKV